jgi:hypothetical protein
MALVLVFWAGANAVQADDTHITVSCTNYPLVFYKEDEQFSTGIFNISLHLYTENRRGIRVVLEWVFAFQKPKQPKEVMPGHTRR